MARFQFIARKAGNDPVFIIWATSYDETSGGVIALHALCDRLNQLGVRSAIWRPEKPAPPRLRGWKGLARLILWVAWRRKKIAYSFGPFKRRTAGYRALRNAIVIYPEVVTGNPLGADRVVRWLLYPPGAHTGEIQFGEDDLFFFYQKSFNDSDLNPHEDHLLRVSMLHPAYRQTNFGARSGSAYIVRKGAGRPLDQHPPDAINVDHFSHEQKAEIFNKVERLYSYDLYTMYSAYAALCGCISIVIPDPAMDKDQWYPDADRRYGLAYGAAEEVWAQQTHPALIERLKSERLEEDELVRKFVETCHRWFGGDHE